MRTDLVWMGLRTIIDEVQEMQKSTAEVCCHDETHKKEKVKCE